MIIDEIISKCKGIASDLSNEKLLGEGRVRQASFSIVKKLGEKFKEHLKKIGKKQTISVEKIAELNKKNKMPTMIKHCVVAVQPQLRSEGKEVSFIGAHNICVWSFNKHGLVKKDGTISSKGKSREKFHKTKADLGAGAKTAKYNKTYNSIFGK